MKPKPTPLESKPPMTTRLRESVLRGPLSPNDDRERMRMVMDSLVLHIHPSKVSRPALKFSYTFGFYILYYKSMTRFFK